MRIRRRSSRLSVLLVAVGAAVLAGCGSGATATPGASSAPATTSAGASGETQVTATFAEGTGPGWTYNTARVPVGATATVAVTSSGTETRTVLTVTGLNPNSMYGSHAHAKPCGATGDAAGPHYQLRQDPVTPSVDPAYANPTNEIWLDLTTDAQGAGTATSTVPWTFPADRRAQSVIIHDMTTMTEPGKAGTAGSRPGCVDVTF